MVREEAALSRAMHEEALHFLAVHDYPESAQDIVRDCSAVMFGAAIGEARRLVRERGEAVAAELRSLAGVAEAIEQKLPHRLYLTWRAHFVDGRTLSECARVAGIDEAAARVHYHDLIGVLVSVVQETEADTTAGPEVLRLVARSATVLRAMRPARIAASLQRHS